MRELPVVIEQIKEAIPDNALVKTSGLDYVKRKCEFTCPEGMGHRWNELHHRLQTDLIDQVIADNQEVKTWQVDVMSIFSTKPKEDIMKWYEENRSDLKLEWLER